MCECFILSNISCVRALILFLGKYILRELALSQFSKARLEPLPMNGHNVMNLFCSLLNHTKLFLAFLVITYRLCGYFYWNSKCIIKTLSRLKRLQFVLLIIFQSCYYCLQIEIFEIFNRTLSFIKQILHNNRTIKLSKIGNKIIIRKNNKEQ